MHAFEQSVIHFVQGLYDAVGWLGVVIAMTIESACIPLPSEVIMPLAGWFLVEARGLPWYWTLLAGFYGAVGCTLGSALAYWVGAIGGRPFILKYGRYVLISPHHVDLADRWFARRGEATAFLSRLLPVVRTFISFPAGIARMHFGRFLLYTFLGSLPWCWALAYAGLRLAENWHLVRERLHGVDVAVAALVAVAFAWAVWHRVRAVRLT